MFSIQDLPQLKPLTLGFCLSVMSLGAASAQTAAPIPIISANPHPTICSGGPCLPNVASYFHVAVNAYHVDSQSDVNSVIGFPSYGKPKIISDDAGNQTIANNIDWMQDTCSAGLNFEHFAEDLTIKATRGQSIGTYSTFPADSKSLLQAIASSCASDLEANGKLTISGTQFRWRNPATGNEKDIQLVGFSSMGAVVGDNFNITQYLDTLEDYGVNLTRVWAVEQWTALAVRKAGAPHTDQGITPFKVLGNGQWDLDQISSTFLSRLKSFVQQAAQRGIVVQVTLFDRHGLKNVSCGSNALCYGSWMGSPYNSALNVNGVFSAGPSGQPPANFLDTSGQAWDLNYSYFASAVVNALRSEGNVIFEIMNEPRAQGAWTESKITAWHRKMATYLRLGPLNY